jgi:Fe-coproporphyrin III synthase
LDLIAVSLDGPPALHNEVRGSKIAFSYLLAGLDDIRKIGFKFGIIHTLTRQSWEHLLWVAKFASEHHSSLLQIHPLELGGRANLMMQLSTPDDEILARVYLLVLALIAKYGNSMTIQYDIFNRDYVKEDPGLVYASDFEINLNKKIKPADLLHIIVVEASGSVVPLSYGFSKKYELCNLKNKRLSEAWPHYLERGRYIAFRNLCQSVFREISQPTHLPFFNWHETIVAHSHKSQ